MPEYRVHEEVHCYLLHRAVPESCGRNRTNTSHQNH